MTTMAFRTNDTKVQAIYVHGKDKNGNEWCQRFWGNYRLVTDPAFEDPRVEIDVLQPLTWGVEYGEDTTRVKEEEYRRSALSKANDAVSNARYVLMSTRLNADSEKYLKRVSIKRQRSLEEDSHVYESPRTRRSLGPTPARSRPLTHEDSSRNAQRVSNTSECNCPQCSAYRRGRVTERGRPEEGPSESRKSTRSGRPIPATYNEEYDDDVVPEPPRREPPFAQDWDWETHDDGEQ